jgi:uncharacterized protein YeaO (DUF488 family)
MHDLWYSNLAPPRDSLRKHYCSTMKSSWNEFKEEYLQYLHTFRESTFEELVKRSLKGNLTFLCVEENYLNCHRYPLASELHLRNPNTILDLR